MMWLKKYLAIPLVKYNTIKFLEQNWCIWDVIQDVLLCYFCKLLSSYSEGFVKMLTCCEIQHDFLRVQSKADLYHLLLALLYQCLYDCNSFWAPLYSVLAVQNVGQHKCMSCSKTTVCHMYLPRVKKNVQNASLHINSFILSFK